MDVNLKEYFEKAKGTGVLATADGKGLVDTAIYAKPHIMDKETVAFIMAERLTHHNLQTNTMQPISSRRKAQGIKAFDFF